MVGNKMKETQKVRKGEMKKGEGRGSSKKKTKKVYKIFKFI
jgi:hypothetical protein